MNELEVSGCICQHQHRIGYCTEKGCPHQLNTLLENSILVDWQTDAHGTTPLEIFDSIFAEYRTTWGKPAPDAEMAHTVERVRHRLMDWFGAHREAIRAALAAPTQSQEGAMPVAWASSGLVAFVKAEKIKESPELAPYYPIPLCISPPAAKVDEGWQLVPKEPTEHQLGVLYARFTGWITGRTPLTGEQMTDALKLVYRDTINAAPAGEEG